MSEACKVVLQLSLLIFTEITQSGKNEGSDVRLPWAQRRSGHTASSPSHRWLRNERVKAGVLHGAGYKKRAQQSQGHSAG